MRGHQAPSPECQHVRARGGGIGLKPCGIWNGWDLPQVGAQGERLGGF